MRACVCVSTPIDFYVKYRLTTSVPVFIYQHSASMGIAQGVTDMPTPAKKPRDDDIMVMYGSCLVDEDELAKIDLNTEFKSYITTVPVPISSNPLDWWKLHGDKFANFRECANHYLGVCATSCASERAFSTAGMLLTAKRNRLASDTVRVLHFLCKNL